MAKNDDRLGFDPLAWMDSDQKAIEDNNNPEQTNVLAKDADTTTSDARKPAARKKTVARKKAVNARKTMRKTAVKKKSVKQAVSKNSGQASMATTVTETEKPDMSDLIKDSFAALDDQAEEITTRFYEQLFKQFPQVQPLFSNTDIKQQSKMLLAAIKLVVNSLDKPEALDNALASLGTKHQGYGALPQHYPAVAETLLQVMAQYAGDLWTDEVAQAWSDALNIVAEKMLATYTDSNTITSNSTEVKTMATKQTDANNQLQTAMLNAMTSAVMTIDRDLIITYVNPSAHALMKSVEQRLRQNFPSFDADNLVGVCIDDFHKNPAHQRRLLSDPVNLPYKGMVDLGDIQFDLNVTPLYDDQGNFIGACQEWKNITDILINDDRVSRMEGMLESINDAVMTIDRDLVINYVNPATIKLLSKYETELKSLFKDFSVENIVGTCIDGFHVHPEHQRKLLADPNNLPYRTDIQVGPLTFDIFVTAIMDKNGDYVGSTLEWLDVTEIRKSELQVARLSSSIGGSQTATMIADADLNIVYMNDAVTELLRNREKELQNVLPGFKVDTLIGTNIDTFHKNPEHQRKLLSDMSRLPYQTEIQVLDLYFDLNVIGIVDKDGNYMGNSVEWRDITEVKVAQNQIEELIMAAAQGDLSQRLQTDEFDGFMRDLGAGINQMLDEVVRPLHGVAEVIKALQEGNLLKRMEGEYQGEFAVLQEAMNKSMENLFKMVSEIRGSASHISSAANEISQGNTDLSQRTEEQASSLEETASSMEQLTSTVKQNADNSRQANHLAAGAREQAQEGGDVINSTISAMEEINSSSKKIEDIIGVIDEIAFQTNLLALNAAVEAARAGEQGRGFAVVASEVRSLAQRSAAAAKEIKALIKDSVEKVDEGTRLVDESGKTLGEIVSSVRKVSDIIAEIAAASSEQSAGIEQINKAITQLDEVTQQNAALVEEAAAASESMDDQAKNLNEMMNFFEIGETGADAVIQPAKSVKATPRPTPAVTRQPAATPAAEPTVASDDSVWEEF